MMIITPVCFLKILISVNISQKAVFITTSLNSILGIVEFNNMFRTLDWQIKIKKYILRTKCLLLLSILMKLKNK